jgi:hypothetical protein
LRIVKNGSPETKTKPIFAGKFADFGLPNRFCA